MLMNSVKDFNEMFGSNKPVVGMVHLLPLPGGPCYDDKGLDSVIERALRDADALIKGGVNAIQVENYSDPSYFVNHAAYETVAALSVIANEIRREHKDIPMGICLLADPQASLAVAHCVKAQFVRATFFTEAGVDVGGLALRSPHQILRYRKFLDPSIKIFADVHIKHSAPLGIRSIEESAYDAAYFCADAVIISGKHTGKETNLDDVIKVKEVLPDFPVMIGSGINIDNADKLFKYADGAFAGTTLKYDGDTDKEVSLERVQAFMGKVNEIRNK